MIKTTQKEIKKFDRKAEIWARVEKWQKEHNTTAMPDAYNVGLKEIAYSAGTYGCNGRLFEDINTGKWLGTVGRDYLIYL